MAVFKCKMCGGTIEFEQEATVGVCDSCGTKQTLPKLDDDKKCNMYDRADHFRRNNDFDKAMSIYEHILDEDNTDAEAYWSIVLCRYGIEYVEDPATQKLVPTVNRAQYTSVLADEDYKSAIRNADAVQREIYEEEARAIDEIQKGILEISQKEDPFDIFICYKETDANGRRTQDSVLATDLYYQLVQEGFKVFFSRITLEDKIGIAYEPYIFAALNSARVMVVLGTKQEYFNAVWVKNEWSRYLALVKLANGKKVLIPAYRDMDPYDLPEEFSHLQAQDMSKLGFMQDLIRGIKKILHANESELHTAEKGKKSASIQDGSNTNIEPLLKRVDLFLEDGNWKEANEYAEKILDIDPENARAYLGKLMSELKISRTEKLQKQDWIFDERSDYKKAYRFGDENIRELLDSATKTIIYNKAVTYKSWNTIEGYEQAILLFDRISDWKDALSLSVECHSKIEEIKDMTLCSGINIKNEDTIASLLESIKVFKAISGWKNADELAKEADKRIDEITAERKVQRKKNLHKSLIFAVGMVFFIIPIILFAVIYFIIPNGKYNDAKKNMEKNAYEQAITIFKDIEGFRDSKEQIEECKKAIELEELYGYALDAMNDGEYEHAISLFERVADFRDSKILIEKCKERINEVIYSDACNAMQSGDHEQAMNLFESLGDFRDSADKIIECQELIEKNKSIIQNMISKEYMRFLQNGYQNSSDRDMFVFETENGTSYYDASEYMFMDVTRDGFDDLIIKGGCGARQYPYFCIYAYSDGEYKITEFWGHPLGYYEGNLVVYAYTREEDEWTVYRIYQDLSFEKVYEKHEKYGYYEDLSELSFMANGKPISQEEFEKAISYYYDNMIKFYDEETGDFTAFVRINAENLGLPENSSYYEDIFDESFDDELKFEEKCSEYILWDSDIRYLDERSLYGLSAEECRLARNEIYARHGRKFTDKNLQNFFDSCPWYHPVYEPSEFHDEWLSDIERANIALLKEAEERGGY